MLVKGFRDEKLSWHPCEPGGWERNGKVEEGKREGRGGSWKINQKEELVVAADAKKDYWRRAFYSPLLVPVTANFAWSL
jgi:hypothetical protein